MITRSLSTNNPIESETIILKIITRERFLKMMRPLEQIFLRLVP